MKLIKKATPGEVAAVIVACVLIAVPALAWMTALTFLAFGVLGAIGKTQKSVFGWLYRKVKKAETTRRRAAAADIGIGILLMVVAGVSSSVSSSIDEQQAARHQQKMAAEKAEREANKAAAEAEKQRLAEKRADLVAKAPEITAAVAGARKQIDDGDAATAQKTVDATRAWLATYDEVGAWPEEVTQAKRDLDAVQADIDKARQAALRSEAIASIKGMREAEKKARKQMEAKEYGDASETIAAALGKLDRFESIELPDEVAKVRDDLKALDDGVDALKEAASKEIKKVDPGDMTSLVSAMHQGDGKKESKRAYKKLLKELHRRFPGNTYEDIGNAVLLGSAGCLKQNVNMPYIEVMRFVEMMTKKGEEYDASVLATAVALLVGSCAPE